MDIIVQCLPDAPDSRRDDLAAVVPDLIRQLVQAIGNPTGSADLLLDCIVDGVHYRLVGSAPAASQGLRGLSPRELEIARMVGRGHTTKTIADVLDISLWTVATHLRRVFAKLGVSTRAAMIGVLSGDPELSSPAAPIPAQTMTDRGETSISPALPDVALTGTRSSRTDVRDAHLPPR